MALYSKSTQDAMNILTQIAKNDGGKHTSVSDIAEATGISAPTVAKTALLLAKRMILESRKGPGGGFILGLPPERVSLGDIVVAVEGREPFEDCVAGLASCSEENFCPLHEKWKGAKESILKFLATTTLEDMVLGMNKSEEMNQTSPGAGPGGGPLPNLPPNGPPGGESD